MKGCFIKRVEENLSKSIEEFNELFKEESAYRHERTAIRNALQRYAADVEVCEQLQEYRTRLEGTTHAETAQKKLEKRRNKAMKWLSDATDAKALRYARDRITAEYKDVPDMREELLARYFERATELGLTASRVQHTMETGLIRPRSVPYNWHKTFDMYNMTLNELRQLIDGDYNKLQYISRRVAKEVEAEGRSDKHDNVRHMLVSIRREIYEQSKQYNMYNYSTADNPQRRDTEIYRGVNPPILYMSDEAVRAYVGTDLMLIARIRDSMDRVQASLNEHDTAKASQVARIRGILSQICLELH